MLDLINPARWFKNRSFQNFLSLSFIQGSNMLIGILATPIIFGAVGEEQFGLINLALSIMMLLNVAVSYGYHMSGPREVALSATNPEKLSGLFTTTIFSKALIATFSIVVLIFLVYPLGVFPSYGQILLFSMPLLLAEVVFPLWLLQGLERMKALSIGNLIAKIFYVVLLFVFVNNLEDAYRVNFFLGSSSLLVNVTLIFLIGRKWGIRLKLPKIHSVVSSIKDNVYLFFASIAGHIAVNSSVIILSNIISDAALGTYSLAQKVPFLLRMVPILVAQSLLPKASRLYRDDKPLYFSSTARAYKLTLAISFFISFCTWVFSAVIVDFLSAGTNTEAVEILNLLAFIPLLSSLNIGNMLLVLSSDSKKLLFSSTWLSTVIMLVLGIWLSIENGVIGMAYALLIAEFVTFLIQTFVNLRGLSVDTKAFYSRCFGFKG